jgi:predicted transcriptional regulator
VTRVSDLMTSPAITCRGDATLAELAQLLLERRVHGVVVPGDDGSVAGVVSDTDLLAGEWLATDEPSFETMRSLTARDLLTTPVVTIDAAADAAEAAELLRAQRLARLVVLRDGTLVGVLATSDFVGLLARGPVARGSVADVMSHGVVACREQTTVRLAARAMTERRSRSLVVVSPAGRPLGVVTGSDLLALVEDGASERPVSELMHEPYTIAPNATLREAADELLRREVHRLLVVDPAERDAFPLGVVSTTDIVAEMAAPGSPWR